MGWILDIFSSIGPQWPGFSLSVSAKATLVVLTAWVFRFAFRHASAAKRHLIWTVLVGCLLILPVLSLILPVWPVALAEHPLSVQVASHGHAVSQSEPGAAEADVVVLPGNASRWYSLTLVIWAAGLLAVLARTLAGMGRVWWMTRTAKRIEAPDWNRLCSEFGGAHSSSANHPAAGKRPHRYANDMGRPASCNPPAGRRTPVVHRALEPGPFA